MTEGEAARKKEKLQELVQQKERAHRQADEIITAKAVRAQSIDLPSEIHPCVTANTL